MSDVQHRWWDSEAGRWRYPGDGEHEVRYLQHGDVEHIDFHCAEDAAIFREWCMSTGAAVILDGDDD